MRSYQDQNIKLYKFSTKKNGNQLQYVKNGFKLLFKQRVLFRKMALN